jgi:hypothetical protein
MPTEKARRIGHFTRGSSFSPVRIAEEIARIRAFLRIAGQTARVFSATQTVWWRERIRTVGTVLLR